jgi:hypothetical protein
VTYKGVNLNPLAKTVTEVKPKGEEWATYKTESADITKTTIKTLTHLDGIKDSLDSTTLIYINGKIIHARILQDFGKDHKNKYEQMINQACSR